MGFNADERKLNPRFEFSSTALCLDVGYRCTCVSLLSTQAPVCHWEWSWITEHGSSSSRALILG